MVPGSIPGCVTGDFFHGSPRQNHVPWGRLRPWKWVPGISPGVTAAGAYGWWPTTLIVLNVKKIRGLNLPGTPWATSACCRMTFTFMGSNPCPKFEKYIQKHSDKIYLGFLRRDKKIMWLMWTCKCMCISLCWMIFKTSVYRNQDLRVLAVVVDVKCCYWH